MPGPEINEYEWSATVDFSDTDPEAVMDAFVAFSKAMGEVKHEFVLRDSQDQIILEMGWPD